MAVTMKDIAKAAGVDPAAVSRALNNDPNSRLRPETCRRIKETAEKMGYRKNLLAASIRKGFAKTVAIIYDFHKNIDFTTQQLAGILKKCVEDEYDVKLYSGETSPEETFGQMISSAIKYGVVFSFNASFREKTASLARKYGIRLVFIDEAAHGEFPSVGIDNMKAMELAVDHLVQENYTKIGFWGVKNFTFHYQHQRHRGFLEALERRSLPFEKEWLFDCDTSTEKECERLFSMPERSRPQAIISISHHAALDIQFYMLRNHLSCPEDLAMASMAGMTFDETMCFWHLTSIKTALSLGDQGRLALEALFDKCPIKADRENNILISPEMNIKESSINKGEKDHERKKQKIVHPH